MRTRRKAREYALKILYAVDITREDHAACAEAFWRHTDDSDGAARDFADALVKGVMAHLGRIDALLSASATNWQLSRMAVVDRNVLRLAAYELLYVEDIPAKVSINEAVDIAKRYGDAESGKFVNGILDKISKTETEKAL